MVLKKDYIEEKMKRFLTMFILDLFFVLFLSGCTISILLTSSHGTDNDVDSAPVNETKTDADLSVPGIP